MHDTVACKQVWNNDSRFRIRLIYNHHILLQQHLIVDNLNMYRLSQQRVQIMAILVNQRFLVKQTRHHMIQQNIGQIRIVQQVIDVDIQIEQELIEGGIIRRKHCKRSWTLQIIQQASHVQRLQQDAVLVWKLLRNLNHRIKDWYQRRKINHIGHTILRLDLRQHNLARQSLIISQENTRIIQRRICGRVYINALSVGFHSDEIASIHRHQI
mmetsp:Transcript_42013/g.69198  ORF Transcript_42013/g.69198 Transcript_42013/m.69198 type:complete len:212 (+) Transcript_42013:382-1017(+)